MGSQAFLDKKTMFVKLRVLKQYFCEEFRPFKSAYKYRWKVFIVCKNNLCFFQLYQETLSAFIYFSVT